MIRVRWGPNHKTPPSSNCPRRRVDPSSRHRRNGEWAPAPSDVCVPGLRTPMYAVLSLRVSSKSSHPAFVDHNGLLAHIFVYSPTTSGRETISCAYAEHPRSDSPRLLLDSLGGMRAFSATAPLSYGRVNGVTEVRRHVSRPHPLTNAWKPGGPTVSCSWGESRFDEVVSIYLKLHRIATKGLRMHLVVHGSRRERWYVGGPGLSTLTIRATPDPKPSTLSSFSSTIISDYRSPRGTTTPISASPTPPFSIVFECFPYYPKFRNSRDAPTAIPFSSFIPSLRLLSSRRRGLELPVRTLLRLPLAAIIHTRPDWR